MTTLNKVATESMIYLVIGMLTTVMMRTFFVEVFCKKSEVFSKKHKLDLNARDTLFGRSILRFAYLVFRDTVIWPVPLTVWIVMLSMKAEETNE